MSGNKSVVFYAISSDFSQIVLKLCEKFYESKENTLLLTSSDDETRFFDAKIWTYSRLGFIPHGSKFSIPDDKIDFCRIWISDEIEFKNSPSSLIHNGVDIKNKDLLKNFDKIIDIFNISDMDSSRIRSEDYRCLGFDQQKIWIQDKTSWKPGVL